MKTTSFYSPLFAESETDGKRAKASPLVCVRDINAALEKWNDRFAGFLLEKFSEIKAAKFSFSKWGDNDLVCSRHFLAAAVEYDDDFSEKSVAAALSMLYNDDLAEGFSQTPINYLDGMNMFVSLWNREESFVLTKEELEKKLDLRYKLYCRCCKYMKKIGNTDETGQALCTFRPNYEPTTLDTRCRFLPETAELRCGDCARLGNDSACFTCSAEDSATPDGELCFGFVDKHEEELFDILAFWKLHNVYSRERILNMIDRFENEFKSPLE